MNILNTGSLNLSGSTALPPVNAETSIQPDGGESASMVSSVTPPLNSPSATLPPLEQRTPRGLQGLIRRHPRFAALLSAALIVPAAENIYHNGVGHQFSAPTIDRDLKVLHRDLVKVGAAVGPWKDWALSDYLNYTAGNFGVDPAMVRAAESRRPIRGIVRADKTPDMVSKGLRALSSSEEGSLGRDGTVASANSILGVITIPSAGPNFHAPSTVGHELMHPLGTFCQVRPFTTSSYGELLGTHLENLLEEGAGEIGGGRLATADSSPPLIATALLLLASNTGGERVSDLAQMESVFKRRLPEFGQQFFEGHSIEPFLIDSLKNGNWWVEGYSFVPAKYSDATYALFGAMPKAVTDRLVTGRPSAEMIVAILSLDALEKRGENIAAVMGNLATIARDDRVEVLKETRKPRYNIELEISDSLYGNLAVRLQDPEWQMQACDELLDRGLSPETDQLVRLLRTKEDLLDGLRERGRKDLVAKCIDGLVPPKEDDRSPGFMRAAAMATEIWLKHRYHKTSPEKTLDDFQKLAKKLKDQSVGYTNEYLRERIGSLLGQKLKSPVVVMGSSTDGGPIASNTVADSTLGSGKVVSSLVASSLVVGSSSAGQENRTIATEIQKTSGSLAPAPEILPLTTSENR